ncbi:MAG: M3 family oligoendopeptidase, partial [Tepidisphaeraceae bacterium]
MPATLPPRRYVPPGFDVADVTELERLYRGLLFRPVDSVEQLRRWLEDFSELSASVDEYGSRRYIEKSCHTEDEGIKRRYLHFVEVVEPRIKPMVFQLQKKYLASSFHEQMGEPFEMMARKWKADVEIFR